MSQTPIDSRGLTPQQRREMLLKLLRQKAQSPRETPTSFSQERLWILDQIGEDGTCYNIVFHFSVRGELRAEVLDQALTDVVARHETLRSTFLAGAGTPQQSIAPATHFAAERIDLSAASDSSRQELVCDQIRRHQQQPFDLSRGPLFRASLLTLATDHHLLVFAMHHIISDGWSVGIFARELGEAYTARAGGGAPAFAPLPAQYSDYAAVQRKWLESDTEAARQLSYWEQNLLEVVPLELPTDFARSPRQRFHGDQRTISLPRELSQRIRELSSRSGASVFMTCLAAFAALLSRISGQHDIAIGTPIANRNRAEIESLIGFFVNMIVLRVDAGGDLTFQSLIERCRRTCLDAYAAQDYPFERLVERLQPGRDTGRNPLFQVALTVHNETIDPPRFPGAEVSSVQLPGFTVGGEFEAPTLRTRFDLEMHLWDRPEGIVGTLIFDSDLFRPQTIEQWIESFVALLSAGIEQPQTPLSDLHVVSQGQGALLHQFSSRPAAYPRQASVPLIFEQQATAHTDRIALVHGQVRWTYAELNAHANSIASSLIRAGVRKGDRVPLLAKRSAQTIAAILGILKCGAAYVPLDPAYPRRRLEVLADMVGATVMVAERSFLDQAQQIGHRTIVQIDEAAAPMTSANPKIDVHGDDAAYVMFTSGSTGEPKGVVIPHRGINRLVLNNDFCVLDQDQVLLQMASLAFDASTFEIWGALLNGGRCVLYEHDLPTPSQIGDAIRRHGVNTMFITTALFNTVVDEDMQALAPMRQVIFGGEVCSAPHVRKALAALPDLKLIHAYGPTEVTTFSTCYAIPRTLDDRQTTIPIGPPICNTSARVLDERRNLVPPSVPGELYLGGDGVALGYLDQPELSAQRFLDLDGNGNRWYRTGDIVRWTGDGLLEFVGRADQQVKVHGFRIELGEIEAALVRCDSVRNATVIAAGEGAGKRLVAYLVPTDPSAKLDWDAIRTSLRQSLPEYMIPVQHVQLDRLPLNANGKVDRRALPEPVSQPRAKQTAPSSDLEHTLADLWAQVLEVDQVGLDDNFFDLGGQSLLLVKLHERLTRTLQIDLPVVDLFRFTTVRAQASHFTSLRDNSAAAASASSSAAARGAAARQREAILRSTGAMPEGRIS